MKILKRYKKQVFKNNQLTTSGQKDMLYWRKYLFSNVVIYTLPLCLIALIPGLYVSYLTSQTLIFVVDSLAFLALITMAFYPGWSFLLRKNIFTITNYVLAFVLLLTMGLTGPGELYLLSVAVFSVLIYPHKYAFYWALISMATCLLSGFLVYSDIYNGIMNNKIDFGSWLAVSANLVFLSALASLLLPKLFKGLEDTIQQQQELASKLQNKTYQLEGAMQKLARKNKELNQFASIASHDLKEPVRLIKSYMDLLKNKYGEQLDERAKKYIDFASSSSQQMVLLIDELLSYAKLDGDEGEVEEVEMEKIIQESIDFNQHVINESNAQVTFETNDHVIKGYRVLIKNLLNNLLSNALKYVEQGENPIVHISVDDVGESYILRVVDNGIGISPEFHEKIFDMFSRLNSQNEYSGTGLGLAICKKIMQKHNGSIKVKLNDNQGVEFYCEFPKK